MITLIWRSYIVSYDPYQLLSVRDVKSLLATRVRALRLERNWKQATLAERSGVTLASLRRFETTGAISLTSLLKLSMALGRLEEVSELFQPPEVKSIQEVEKRAGAPTRKRGSQ